MLTTVITSGNKIMARKTFKFRLYPNKVQSKKLEMWLSLSCELYNAGLQERRDAWGLNRVSISYADQNKQLTEIKTIRPELMEVNSQVLQDSLRRLDKSFKAFFRRVKSGEKPGFPRFKSYRRFDSFSVPKTRYKIAGNKFDLSRLGQIKFKQDREIVGAMKTATLKRQCGKWYVCISVDFTPEVLSKTHNQIGIDVGLKFFAVLSNSETISNERYAEKLQKQLRVAQRRVSRRKKGSNRRRKAVLQVQKKHQKIFNQRNDFQHKLSTQIITENDLIAIEKLNHKELSKGILAKQVADASWSSFFDKLRYKAENADRDLVEVNPNGTSQTCICGENVPKTLAVRVHKCASCGLEADRDFVSAQVILQRAQAERSAANVNR